MISKIIHSKIFIFIVLLIIFSFVINTNISYARKISFSLHDGLITTLIGNEEDDEDRPSNEEKPDDEERPNDEEKPNDEERPDDEEKPDDEESQNNNLVKDGIYYIAYSQDTDYVLDVKQGNLDNGGTLQLNTRNNDTNQKFYIHHIEDGYYQIENISSTKTIEVKNASTETGAVIQQYDDNGTDAQRWKIIKNEDETYTFIAKCSEKAIDIANGVIEAGTVIRQYDCNNTNAQKFILEETELFNEGLNHGIVIIRSRGDTTKHLDVTNCSPEEGTPVHLWTDSPTLAQRFQLERVGKNEVRIRTAASGGYLKESENKKGASVIQSGNSKTKPTDSDTWKVEYDKGIIFINKESGLALTINGDYVDDAKIEVNARTDDLKQRFIVRPIDLIPTGYYNIQSAYGTMLAFPDVAVGTPLQTATKSGKADQIFKISFEGNGYKILAPSTGYVIDVQGGSKDNAAIVHMQIDAGTTSERWEPVIIDGGYLTFRNINSKLMLNVHLFNSEPGAVVNQGKEDGSDAQKWKLIPTKMAAGWVENNGQWYCYDPKTGELVKNTTRVDPMMQDPAQYGAIYDFDSEGRATWHLPTQADLPGGTGPNAPVPTNLLGDRRQRVLQMALSRLGCPYQSGNAPTGFVCDGLTAWSYTTALGDWFYTGPGSREDLQDASWQWDKIKNRNGIKTNINDFKPGDLVFFGNPQLTYGPGQLDYNGPAYHAGIYYGNGIMINSTSTVSPGGVCFMKVSDYYLWNKFLGGGSPYEAETSRVQIPN